MSLVNILKKHMGAALGTIAVLGAVGVYTLTDTFSSSKNYTVYLGKTVNLPRGAPDKKFPHPLKVKSSTRVEGEVLKWSIRLNSPDLILGKMEAYFLSPRNLSGRIGGLKNTFYDDGERREEIVRGESGKLATSDTVCFGDKIMSLPDYATSDEGKRKEYGVLSFGEVKVDKKSGNRWEIETGILLNEETSRVRFYLYPSYRHTAGPWEVNKPLVENNKPIIVDATAPKYIPKR